MNLRASAVLAAIALVSVSCGSRVRQETWDDLSAQDGKPSVSSNDQPESDQTADATSGDTTATRTATTRRSSGTKSSAGEDAGALPAPADGTYTYDESGGGNKRTATEQWTAQRQSDAVLLTSVLTEKEGDDTITNTSKARVTKSALELLSQTSVYNDEEPDNCTFKPPALVMPLPLKVGAKWKTTGTCEGDDASDESALSFQITGRADDTIGGVAVKTFVMKGTQSFDSTDDTTGERTTYTFTDTRHVDPSTLLVVIEDITFDFDGKPNTVHRQLRSLTPA